MRSSLTSALPGVVLTLLALVAALAAPDATAAGLRSVLGQVTLARLLVLAGLVAGLAAVRSLALRRGARWRGRAAWLGRLPSRRLARTSDALGSLVDRTPWPLAVLSIAAVAGAGWYALGRALVLPRIFADELIYVGAARNLAERGSLPGYGYSLVTPVLDAAAFLLTASDVTAYRLIQGLNVAVVVTAAFPAYLVARRALCHRRALAVAALTVAVPWIGYARFALTEAAFYPVFLLFVLALVRALERPTRGRQLVLAAALVLAVATRTQAVALAGAIPAAVLLHGASSGRVRSLLRAFAATWTLYVVAGTGIAVLAATGRWSPLGAYGVLVENWWHPRGFLLWAAANITSLSLGLGVLVAGAAPLGVAAMLRRHADVRERALASAAVASTLALLLTVVVLSVSPYGLGLVLERNLFYVVPLVFACALAWAARGFPRPPLITAVLLGGFAGLALLMPPGVVTPTSFSFKLWTQLDGRLPVWTLMVTAVVAGAAVLARVRSVWPLVAATVLAGAGVAAASDYRSDVPRSVVPRYGWIDRTLALGQSAAILWIGYDETGCPPGTRPSALGKLALYTEFFNSRVGPVGHLLADNRARGLATPAFAVASGGVVTVGGAALQVPFVVADARVELVGSRVARLRARDVGIAEGAPESALELWRTAPPVRLRRPAAALGPAAACAPFPAAP